MADLKQYRWCAMAVVLILVSGCTGTESQSSGMQTKSAVPAVGAVENKVETPPRTVVKVAEAKPAAPKPETPKPEAPKPEAPKPEAPKPATPPKPEVKALEYTAVDLAAALNANAAGGETGLDGWGNRYPADKLPTGTKPLSSVQFNLPDFKAEKNVVTADGQTLKVDQPGKYSTLFVLAAATNGSQQTTIELSYGDAKTDAVLKVSDWCAKASFGEVEAITVPRVGENETVDCRVFIQKIALDPAKDLTAITLPKSDDLHIFAMTLAK